MSCGALKYLCGARGGGANYPAAPGAAAVVVATKLRMTNELSAGGSRGGQRSSPGGGKKVEWWRNWLGASALRSQRPPCVSHLDTQHIVAGRTFSINTD